MTQQATQFTALLNKLNVTITRTEARLEELRSQRDAVLAMLTAAKK